MPVKTEQNSALSVAKCSPPIFPEKLPNTNNLCYFSANLIATSIILLHQNNLMSDKDVWMSLTLSCCTAVTICMFWHM